jgi:hypothetical protein
VAVAVLVAVAVAEAVGVTVTVAVAVAAGAGGPDGEFKAIRTAAQVELADSVPLIVPVAPDPMPSLYPAVLPTLFPVDCVTFHACVVPAGAVAVGLLAPI